MNLTSPNLGIDEEASEDLIKKSITELKDEVDSFAILSIDDMNYIQALATEHGFVVQFQIGSIDEHYEFDTYLSRPQTINLFQDYLQGIQEWQGQLNYSKIQIKGVFEKVGYTLGSFVGGLVKGFKAGRSKT